MSWEGTSLLWVRMQTAIHITNCTKYGSQLGTKNFNKICKPNFTSCFNIMHLHRDNLQKAVDAFLHPQFAGKNVNLIFSIIN